MRPVFTAEQMRRLPYATGYFHFSSEPAIRLAEKLVQIAPGMNPENLVGYFKRPLEA